MDKYSDIEDVYRKLFLIELYEELYRKMYKYDTKEMVKLLIKILEFKKYTPLEMKEIFQKGVDVADEVLKND